MKTRKFLALLLAVAMILGAFCVSAYAANGYTDVTLGGITFQFGDPYDSQYANTSPEQDLQLSTSGNTVTVTYNGPISYYFPDRLSFYVTSGASTITNMVGTGVVVKPTILNNGVYEVVDDFTVGFYVLEINTATSGTKSLVITAGGNTITINFTVPSNAGSLTDSIYAFLPAPGQFTNEGINTGGWGDAYVSGSSAQKNMVENLVGTGVSLGYFGGYVVLKMGQDVYDNPNNPYGIDLITYGNAFIGNSEPGCIQVAQAVDGIPGDANNDGVIWYDIAGSLHYNTNTKTNAEFIYTNPHPTDDTSTTLGYTGTVSTTASQNNVPYTCTPNDASGATSGTVTYNTFHRHAWFPLWANYFYSGTRAPLDKTSSLTFATYTQNTSTGSKLTLTGVMLGDATSTSATGNYAFGYCDVHPKSNTAGNYNKAYNPYAVTATELASGTTWDNFLNPTSGSKTGGGDPIDLAWAVYPAKYDTNYKNANDQIVEVAGTTHPNAGEPVSFASSPIRFVRIYTGAAKMNGIFGEISTEVCGIYVATPSAGSVGTTTAPSALSFTVVDPIYGDHTAVNPAPTIPSNGGTHSYINTIATAAASISATDVGVSVTAVSGAYVYVNGTLLSATGTSGTETVYTGTIPAPTNDQLIRIIVQTGSAAPYLFVYK